jgi:hypothetical protein
MRDWIDLRSFDKLMKHLDAIRPTPKTKVISTFDNYFDEMSRQVGERMGREEGGTFDDITGMPWLEMLKPLPRKQNCYYYVKFDEDNLPNSYNILLTAAARAVGTGPDVIHFLVKTYFEHDNVDATIDRIIYRIQD